ncbi:MAG: hypothetical protein IT365_04315 [Candidatus Hydrogenedentes bacterium]|nr:hypothetical protein [Candidatus Hydrogenedentota bacterium]
MKIARREFLGSSAALAAATLLPHKRCAAAQEAQSSASGRPAFSFLHTYESTGRYWAGLQRSGLLRTGTGIRLVNSPFGTDDRRFNTVARRDGPLHAILEATPAYFIVDRVAGGSPYNAYPFDVDLVRHYAEMLGPKFLGGQVHEVVSNLHNDWGRFVKANPAFATEPVSKEGLQGVLDWDSAASWLEYGTIDDYLGQRHPQSDSDWRIAIEGAMKRQGGRFSGHYSYCEGTHWGELMWHVAYKMGAASCFVEVGPWASTTSALAIASARGAAKAIEKPWGIFYAPWGPDGCTSFIDVADWSWQAPREAMDNSNWPVGPEKGPSTALQRRIFFHAYLSGAWTLHEEWGAEGNLLNWESDELSSYGLVTKALLDFQQACPDVGEPFTPIALVHDVSGALPDSAPWQKLKENLFAYSENDNANAARETGGKAEAVCYPPSAIPELYDIFPSDAPASALAGYPVRISVSAATVADGSAWQQLSGAAQELCPLSWQTHLPKQVNQRASGEWIVAVYNPWGAVRGDVYGVGSVPDSACAATEVLTFKAPIEEAQLLHAWPKDCELKQDGDVLHLRIGPGGLMIVRIRTRA